MTCEQWPMSGPSGNRGLVSNNNDNVIRYPAANVQTCSTAGSEWDWLRCCETQLVKLSRSSDPSLGLGVDNRKYNEPSAPRRIPFYWTRLRGISVCTSLTVILPESTELLTGIMFGGCGKRGDPSCRGGGADARSLFGARDSKEVSLLCLPSRCHHIVAYGECPGIGDNGKGRMLAVTWPAERTLLILFLFLFLFLIRIM